MQHDEGRILVCESGTEPVIRVMVEAATDELCAKYVAQVVDVMKAEGLAVEAQKHEFEQKTPGHTNVCCMSGSFLTFTFKNNERNQKLICCKSAVCCYH